METKESKIHHYLVTNINKGVFKENERIPTEYELMKMFDCSKMTIRKVIEKLKNNEAVYSIRGSAVFVSPFNSEFIFKSLSSKLEITNVKIIPSTLEIPKELTKNYIGVYSGKEFKNTVCYIKIYFKKVVPIAYSINWINNKDFYYSKNKLKSLKYNIFDEKRFYKIISLIKTLPGTEEDAKYFQHNFDYIPTKYTYYFDKSNKATFVRITRINPIYFSSVEKLNKL